MNVKFEDPLFSEQAVVTVGLQSSDVEHDTGIQWSLTLSHLRYYGDPVAVETDGNDSRVDIRQLHMVMFGSLLGLWSVPAEEVREVAVWFQVLWNTLEVAVSKEVIASTLPWLRTMVEIADEILVSQGDDWRLPGFSYIMEGVGRESSSPSRRTPLDHSLGSGIPTS